MAYATRAELSRIVSYLLADNTATDYHREHAVLLPIDGAVGSKELTLLFPQIPFSSEEDFVWNCTRSHMAPPDFRPGVYRLRGYFMGHDELMVVSYTLLEGDDVEFHPQEWEEVHMGGPRGALIYTTHQCVS